MAQQSTSEALNAGLIFLGAGAGGVTRHWLGSWLQQWWGPTFPVGTLIVNVSGCLAMGFLATALADAAPLREEYRSALLVGVLGGYTTFSSFGREALSLAQEGKGFTAALYVLLSVAVGIGAVWAGSAIAGRLSLGA